MYSICHGRDCGRGGSRQYSKSIGRVRAADAKVAAASSLAAACCYTIGLWGEPSAIWPLQLRASGGHLVAGFPPARVPVHSSRLAYIVTWLIAEFRLSAVFLTKYHVGRFEWFFLFGQPSAGLPRGAWGRRLGGTTLRGSDPTSRGGDLRTVRGWCCDHSRRVSFVSPVGGYFPAYANYVDFSHDTGRGTVIAAAVLVQFSASHSPSNGQL